MTSDLQNAISPIEAIIGAARQGKMFILVDHEDRENEGDLVIAAEFADAAAINFMATHGRGLICLPMTDERVSQLGLPMMAVNNSSRHETPFTVSIEAREGVETGISASDRAHTVSVAINEQNTMAQLEVAEQRQAEAASHRNTGVVYVAGPAVARPGTYALPATGNLTLRRVLIAASLERLDEGICTIQRGDQRIEVDLGGDEDPVLLPEDVVTVR